MQHLNVRVAWHDHRWDGTVCQNPCGNSFCVELDGIRATRDDETEQANAGKNFADLPVLQLPACKAESGAFMNSREWTREFNHPYQGIPKTRETHGNLLPTTVKVPPYTTFAIPFLWMLRQQQEAIDSALAEPLPPDSDPPFSSPWVFSKERQKALCALFSGKLTAGKSLVFFYTKSGHPLGESIARLVVGVGTVSAISEMLEYNSTTSSTHPMWDLRFSHSIRPEGETGFLLPYHDYLVQTGDDEEDNRRKELLQEIIVEPEPSQRASFSFAGEVSSSDTALSTLTRCLEAVRKIREHGISAGPWEAREVWLNERLAETWIDRGAFPGIGAALEALGLRLGTALVLELLREGRLKSGEDPWPLINLLLRGTEAVPNAYSADLKSVENIWTTLSDERRSLLTLLSRFHLSAFQAKRWFDAKQRVRATMGVAISDQEILENPYRIVESDYGDANDDAVSLGVVDRGLFPDSTVAAKCPVPTPSVMISGLDQRRIRAAFVIVLRGAAENGDALLSEIEASVAVAKLDLAPPCVLPPDFLASAEAFFLSEIDRQVLVIDAESGLGTPCVQLKDQAEHERQTSKILLARASKGVPSLGADWEAALISAVTEGGGTVNLDEERHRDAFKEQAAALKKITERRLTVLVGRAGTGKTTVLGALLKSPRLQNEGVLFLAPTGKARVRLTKKTNTEAMTIAQFLYGLGRYDGVRQKARFEGKDQHRKEKTVVIDECSMLTLDDMYAVLKALDLGHVERLILVGDPNQLPPIGVGRPFADLVSHLDAAEDPLSGALARLTVELRTSAGAPSDALRLASWYTRELQPVDADRVLSALELGKTFNDLTVRTWANHDELRSVLSEELQRQLKMTSLADITGFNKNGLGLTVEGWVPFGSHAGAELFQILSPVRMQPHGVHDLNRWMQRTFRSKQLQASRNNRGLSLGDEDIVVGDKVILVRNGKKDGWNGVTKQKVEEYLANGEVGVAATVKGDYMNIAFADREPVRYGYASWNFSGGSGPLELAYALTVHKAQGSEFNVVFIVLPQRTRLLTRELLYTALTRAKSHLVLLVEGSDVSGLYDLTKPERSETARRNTNMFGEAAVREEAGKAPYSKNLIHRVQNGEMVRSKSELVIANHLLSKGLPLLYERPLQGVGTSGRLRPDFSFVTDAGDVIVWEHLGMLNHADYRRGWEWKLGWYESNGYFMGENLFTTQDHEDGGLDSIAIAETAERIRKSI